MHQGKKYTTIQIKLVAWISVAHWILMNSNVYAKQNQWRSHKKSTARIKKKKIMRKRNKTKYDQNGSDNRDWWDLRAGFFSSGVIRQQQQQFWENLCTKFKSVARSQYTMRHQLNDKQFMQNQNPQKQNTRSSEF